MEIELDEQPGKGRYTASIADVDATAELTYSRVNNTTVIADHTDVPDVLRGTGIGSALVERLINDARTQGFRIMPLCPFVRSQFARHPDWADVLAG